MYVVAVVAALVPGAGAIVTVLTVQAAGIDEMSEMVTAEMVVVAGAVVIAGAVAVGTVEVAEVVVVGTVEDTAVMFGTAEDAEAFGHQVLYVKTG